MRSHASIVQEIKQNQNENMSAATPHVFLTESAEASLTRIDTLFLFQNKITAEGLNGIVTNPTSNSASKPASVPKS